MICSRRKYYIRTSRTFSPYVSLHFIMTSTHEFQDYEGEAKDVKAGRDYFRKRFSRLAQKAGRSKDREIYVQYVFTSYY